MMGEHRRRAHPGRSQSCVVAALLIVAVSTSLADESVLQLGWRAPSGNGLPEGWQPLTFRSIPRHTRYTVTRDGDRYVIKAEADNSASGLIHRVMVEPARFPILRWRWKVENVLSKGDVTRKSGDDYPARIYVTFAYDPKRASFGQRIKYESARLLFGEYPPHASLNYIWESRAPIGTIVPNPFTDRVHMIVVDSGTAELGQWIEHERNIYQDYREIFNEDPPLVSGIAIMTDTDNTGETAVAYYGEISLRSPGQ